MVKENNKSEEESISESKKQELLEQAKQTPFISEFIDKEADIKAEEKAKRMAMVNEIKSITDDKLVDDLPTYREFESKDFNSIISSREKILQDTQKASEEEMKKLLQMHDLAYRTERSYRNQREKISQRSAESKPTETVSSTSHLPDSLEDVDKDPSRYQRALMKNSEVHYVTNDPHKEYPYYEKNDLGSLFNQDCLNATLTWRNEASQSRARNKRHANRIQIL